MPENIVNFLSGQGVFIIMMIAVVALMIIPQSRRNKKARDMLKALKPGDRVRTIGGIYGTIGSIKDDVVTLVVGPDKVRLVFTRGAISTVEDVAAENVMTEEIKEVN